jgi:hypothetical protein
LEAENLDNIFVVVNKTLIICMTDILFDKGLHLQFMSLLAGRKYPKLKITTLDNMLHLQSNIVTSEDSPEGT